MRKVLKSIAFIAAVAMTLASCQNELQPVQPEVTPGTVVSKGTVHVEFGATSDEPQTKVTLGTSDDVHFDAAWVSGTDKLWIEYAWMTDDDGADRTAISSDPWNGDSFGASLVGPKDAENNDLPAFWEYDCFYPQPRVDGDNHYFAFGANRSQEGANYAGQYDLMSGGDETENSIAGKDGDENVVFKMDRLTSIAYFHITTSGFDASEKLATAVLEITEADDNIIACDEVYYVDGAIYKNGANQSSSITLNTTQAMDDIKLWYNVIPLTFKKATLTLTTDKGKYIVLKMGDGSTEFSYKPGELQKAKIGTIPASAFTNPVPPAPAEPFYTLEFNRLFNSDNIANFNNYVNAHDYSHNEVDWSVVGNQSLGSDLRVGGGRTSVLNGASRTLTSKQTFSESINKVVIKHSGITNKNQTSLTVNSVSVVLSSSSDFAERSIVERKEVASPSVSTEGSLEIELNEAYDNCFVRIDVNVSTDGSGDNAYWTIDSIDLFEGDAKEKYAINIQSVTGGSITANKESASEGTEITLFPTPASARYEFGSWNVKNASTGDSITVTDNKFTMPAAAVNVSATFNKLPYKVTYNKNTDDTSFAGTVPTDAKNYTDADNEVTVADGSGLTRDDYTFASWNTKANGEGTSYESGDKFDISDDVTLYAQWTRNTYEVTIETPVNGTLVIKNGETVVNSGDKLQSGVTLTVVPTPATGYRFDKWGYKDGDKAWVNNMTSTFTHVMPMAPVKFKVTFEEIPTHVIKFSVNGTIVNGGGEGEPLGEGDDITFPSDPSDIGSMKFQGWVTSAIDGTTDTKPSFVSKTGQTVGTEDVTYYAVFASESGTAETWTKTSASAVTAGTYAIITSDGYAFNGTISSAGRGSVTSTAFSFSNGVATSAPDGTCEITIASAATGYTMYAEGKGFLYAKAASEGNLAWHDTESSFWQYYSSSASSNWEYKTSGNPTWAFLRVYNNTFRTYSANNGTAVEFAKKIGGKTITGYSTTIAVLQSIAISGKVNNKTYSEGESLNPAGLTVTATYDKGEPADVTDKVDWTFNPDPLSAGTELCEVTASFGGKKASTTVSGLTVNAAVTLQSVAVSGAPTKKDYKAGDSFDPAGLTVTGTYSDRHQEIITEGITWSEPAALTAGQTSVTITATVNGIKSEEYTVNGLTVTSAGPNADDVLYFADFGTSAIALANYTGHKTYNNASTISYSVSDASYVKIDTNTAGNMTSGNLYFNGKTGGTGLTATISGIKVYGASKVKVTWCANNAKTSVSVSSSSTTAQTSASSDSNSCTFTLTGSPDTINITIKGTAKDNARVDNVKVIFVE